MRKRIVVVIRRAFAGFPADDDLPVLLAHLVIGVQQQRFPGSEDHLIITGIGMPDHFSVTLRQLSADGVNGKPVAGFCFIGFQPDGKAAALEIDGLSRQLVAGEPSVQLALAVV